MNVEDLRTALDVRKLGSFAAVARLRNVDPSAVSRTISSLENELGVRLFNRTTRRLSATDVGADYFGRIEPLLDEIDAAGAEASRETVTVRGTVRIAAPVSIGRALLLPNLGRLRQKHPNLTVEFVFDDRVNDLVAEGLDLAIRMAPAVSGDLICTKLRPTKYRVLASSRWIKENELPDAPQNITQHSCVLFNLPGFRERWLFRNGADKVVEIPVKGNFLFSNADSVVDAMLASHGPALLADVLIEKHVREGSCHDLFPDYEVTATTFETAAWIVYPSRKYLPQKTRAMIDFLKAEIG
ncbi:MAG: LysR family transcriptional regulator [Pseudomonadota bacterium]